MNMTAEEYARYVMQNLGRARVGNAMNIVDKISDGGEYDFLEFLAGVEKYANANLSSKSPDSRISRLIAIAVFRARDRYTSDTRYNKRMVIDNFILDLWEAINGI